MLSISRRLGAIGATFVVLAALSLALPLGASAPPEMLSYAVLSAGILALVVALVLVRVQRGS